MRYLEQLKNLDTLGEGTYKTCKNPTPGASAGWHYWSAILQVDFWVASTERQAQVLRAAGCTVYSAREVALLGQMKHHAPALFADKLRAIHQLKDVLGATIQDVEVPHA